MSVLTIQDWTNIAKAVRIDRVKSVLTIPSFSLTGIVWKGASEIVQQFNYSAASKFYLTSELVIPDNANFGLAIRYRVGEEVTRYKLFDIAGFELQADLYDGQVILPNFVIEVYNLADETTADLDADVTVDSSIRTVPTNVRNMEDITLGDPITVTYAELQNTSGAEVVPSENLFEQYIAENFVTNFNLGSWISEQGVNTLASDPGDVATRPTKSAIPALNNRYAVTFDGVSNFLSASLADAQAFPYTLYALVYQPSWTVDTTLFNFEGTGGSVDLWKRTITPQIDIAEGAGVYYGGLPLTIGSWKVLRFTFHVDQTFDLEIDGDVESGGGPVAMSDVGLFRLGVGDNGSNASFSVATIIIYNEDIVLDSDKDKDIKNWINQEYFGTPAIEIPLTFSESSYWLDNA